MRGADYIFKFLADKGARHVFMVTGGGAMFLNEAVRAEQRLSPIFNQHEQACAIAAEGYVRAGNGIGVINATTGPGGTNTLTGVIGQWLDSIPVIYISGQVKFETTILSCAAPVPRQLGDQEINIVDIVRPVTKYAAVVTDPRALRLELEKAFALAYAGRPGPVWLDIPINVQNTEVSEDIMLSEDAFTPPSQPTPTEDEIASVLADLATAKRPAIIAGHGIRLAGACDAFLALVDQLNIPVLTTFNGFDLISSEHPCFAGRIGTLGNRCGNFVLQSADLLLSIGSRNNVRQISYNWKNFGKQAKKIVVDIDPAELRKPTLKPDLGIHADAGAFISMLARALALAPLPPKTEWLAWSQERRARFPVVPPYTPCPGIVDAYAFAAALSKTVSADTPIIAGNGTACVALFQSGHVKPGHRLFWNSGCASMGYDLPAALGAAVGGKKAVCIAGDGSIQMNLAELQTVLNHRLAVKIFLLDNNGYASIRQTQNGFFDGQKIGCDPDSGLGLPDMLKIATAYGYRTAVIDDECRMETVVGEVMRGNDPVLCVVRLGENTFAPKLSSRKLPDGSIVSPSLEDMFPFLPEAEVRANILEN